jgi:hypothetical protein
LIIRRGIEITFVAVVCFRDGYGRRMRGDSGCPKQQCSNGKPRSPPYIILQLPCGEQKRQNPAAKRYWEVVPAICPSLFVRRGSPVRTLLFICLATSVELILGACRERGRPSVTRDTCSLISKEEVQLVQQTPVKEAKCTVRSSGVFLICQCFYTATEFSKSVNLALVQKDPNQRKPRSPKDFWNEKFRSYKANAKEREGKAQTQPREDTEKGTPPKKISGLGDDAYWLSNRFGGVLYVLKGDAFISIGLGGTEDENSKLEKSKALAQKALPHL